MYVRTGMSGYRGLGADFPEMSSDVAAAWQSMIAGGIAAVAPIGTAIMTPAQIATALNNGSVSQAQTLLATIPGLLALAPVVDAWDAANPTGSPNHLGIPFVTLLLNAQKNLQSIIAAGSAGGATGTSSPGPVVAAPSWSSSSTLLWAGAALAAFMLLPGNFKVLGIVPAWIAFNEATGGTTGIMA